jgi:hypothetical protein
MCKNVILNKAINTALDLPNKALWGVVAAGVVFSLDAGLAIVGDTLDLKAVGTAQVHAVPGQLTSMNSANAALAAASINGITINAWGSVAGANGVSVVGTPPPVGGGGKLIGSNPVIYASEVFRGTTTPDLIPSGTIDFQAICYQVSGVISPSFSVNFKVTGAEFDTTAGNWAFGIGANNAGAPTNIATCNQATVAAAATQMTVNLPSNLTCSLADGAQLCLVYHLTKTSALQEAGKTVDISAEAKVGASVVGLANPVTVAKSAQGAKFTLLPESDGAVYIAATSGNKEFISTDGSSAPASPAKDEDTAFKSSTEVIIGYIKYESNAVVGRSGSSAFNLGLDTANAATLVVDDGQFSASAGGSAGKVYLGTGAIANTVAKAADKWTATWNLDSTKLGQLTVLVAPATSKYTPIQIKVDGLTKIDDTLDADPLGTFTVTLGTAKTPLTDQPASSSLRRIPYDGKVCKVFNIPSPVGAADALSLRITNDSDTTGTITGTLYKEDGTEILPITDLLKGHIDYTKNPPVPRISLGDDGSVNKLELLGPRETVILNSENIATLFGSDCWPVPAPGENGQRCVLEIQSSIPKIEIFNLLRNVENITIQPLSNVSTSAKGVECSPIP